MEKNSLNNMSNENNLIVSNLFESNDIPPQSRLITLINQNKTEITNYFINISNLSPGKKSKVLHQLFKISIIATEKILFYTKENGHENENLNSDITNFFLNISSTLINSNNHLEHTYGTLMKANIGKHYNSGRYYQIGTNTKLDTKVLNALDFNSSDELNTGVYSPISYDYIGIYKENGLYNLNTSKGAGYLEELVGLAKIPDPKNLNIQGNDAGHLNNISQFVYKMIHSCIEYHKQNGIYKISLEEASKLFEFTSQVINKQNPNTCIEIIFNPPKNTEGEFPSEYLNNFSVINKLTKQKPKVEKISFQDKSIYTNFSEDDLNLIQNMICSPIMNSVLSQLSTIRNQFPLQQLIYISKYIITLTNQEFENLMKVSKGTGNQRTFLNTFLACSKTPEIGDKILELAQFEGSEQIFEAYAQLINLQSDVNSDDIDSLAFLRSIISKGEKLLLEAYSDGKGGKVLSVDKKYSSELVKSGAFVKALISKNKSGKVLEKNEFNEKCPYYKIETFSGGSNIIKSDDQLELLSEENYISPEIFSKDDYKMIVNNLKEAYHEIDPQWLDILVANISEDLQNPNVIFYMMRDKQTGKLVSLCKSNKGKHEGQLYLGTHYVEQDLRGDFGFGDYVLKLAIQENQDIDILTGSVAVNNPHLERHINYGGFSATDIVFDTDKKGNSSGELFKVDINKNIKYNTKNKSIYTDKQLKQLSGKPEKNNIIAYKIDSQSGNDQEFKNICKDKFNNGYALTRLFYEKTGNKPDLSQTYIVFEKNEEL